MNTHSLVEKGLLGKAADDSPGISALGAFAASKVSKAQDGGRTATELPEALLSMPKPESQRLVDSGLLNKPDEGGSEELTSGLRQIQELLGDQGIDETALEPSQRRPKKAKDDEIKRMVRKELSGVHTHYGPLAVKAERRLRRGELSHESYRWCMGQMRRASREGVLV